MDSTTHNVHAHGDTLPFAGQPVNGSTLTPNRVPTREHLNVFYAHLMGATPEPRRALEEGQWATPKPEAPKAATSPGPSMQQWANQQSGRSQPTERMYSWGAGRRAGKRDGCQ